VGGTTVTITGTCFTGATGVRFGATAATSFQIVNDTTIIAVSPAGTGTVGVTVVGSASCGTATDPGAFRYVAAGLALTGSQIMPAVDLALLLMIAGLGLMLARQRRRWI
jgi:hypothetical protein